MLSCFIKCRSLWEITTRPSRRSLWCCCGCMNRLVQSFALHKLSMPLSVFAASFCSFIKTAKENPYETHDTRSKTLLKVGRVWDSIFKKNPYETYDTRSKTLLKVDRVGRFSSRKILTKRSTGVKRLTAVQWESVYEQLTTHSTMVCFFHVFFYVLSRCRGFLCFSENKKSSPNPFINDWFDHFDDDFFMIYRYDKGGKSLFKYFDFLF